MILREKINAVIHSYTLMHKSLHFEVKLQNQASIGIPDVDNV